MTEQPPSIDNRINQAANQGKAAKLLKTAIKYGTIKPGWSCIDYMFYAAKHHGWESNIISGPKGSLKSNLLMQHGLAIYKDIKKDQTENLNKKIALVAKAKELQESEDFATTTPITKQKS